MYREWQLAAALSIRRLGVAIRVASDVEVDYSSLRSAAI